jgi:UDPglucose 6-dehydrogenase
VKVGSIGCGNVGLNTLRAFDKRGHVVVGLDPDRTAQQRLEAHFGAGSVLQTIDQLSGVDVVFICVPTEPVPATGAADLSVLGEVVGEFVAREPRDWWSPPVLVQRSTCPPGTASKLSERLRRTPFAVNPSFLAKSTQWQDSDQPSRIAYAGPTEACQVLASLYADFPNTPVFASASYEAVELLKYIENTVDGVLISLWNEYLCLVDALGIPRGDLAAAAEALVDRDRFATTTRAPGGAFGMHCLPKDLRAIIAVCAESGVTHHVLDGALRTNLEIAERLGLNDVPTSDLIQICGGRVVLTSAARKVLDAGGGVPSSPEESR